MQKKTFLTTLGLVLPKPYCSPLIIIQEIFNFPNIQGKDFIGTLRKEY